MVDQQASVGQQATRSRSRAKCSPALIWKNGKDGARFAAPTRGERSIPSNAAVAAPGRQGAMAQGAIVFAAGFVLTIEGQMLAPLLEAALVEDGDEAIALGRVLVTESRLSLVASRNFSAALPRGLADLTGRRHDLTTAAATSSRPQSRSYAGSRPKRTGAWASPTPPRRFPTGHRLCVAVQPNW